MFQIQEIDGRALEGGGQIVRMSISLSAVLNIPVRVKNIRAGRQKPGLAAQHLKGIQLVAEMCQAKLKGAYIGSTEIEFIPGQIRGGHYVADTKTAGSVSLLLQVALPCALFADGPVVMELKGGTNADMAPQIDYMEMVFRKNLNKIGADFNMQILKRGYFPRGGGHVRVEVTPVLSLKSLTLLERGELVDISGISFVAGTLPIKLAYDMAEAAKNELSTTRDIPRPNIRCYKEENSMARDNCNGIVVCCSSSMGCVVGGDALDGRGTRAGAGAGGGREGAGAGGGREGAGAGGGREGAGAGGGREGAGAGGGREGAGAGGRAAAALGGELRAGACLDQHAQDQLIVYLCLSGRSRVLVGPLTLHALTAMYVAEELAGVKFNIIPQGEENIIECNGVGFVNKSIHKE